MSFREVVQLYKRYISGWGELAVMLVVYLFFFLVPAYYTIFTKIPPEAEIKKSEGTLFYKTIPGSGYLVGLHTTNGDLLFNCKPALARGKGCSISKSNKSDIDGKYAVIHWYKQKVYFMSYQNRLIELDVNGRSIIDRNLTIHMMKVGRKLSIIFSVVGFFFMIGLNSISRLILKDNPQ